jgi:hypothetical protein
MIAMLGAVGTGIVWGWVVGPGRRLSARAAVARAAATLLVAGEVLALSGWLAVPAFVGAAGAGLAAHVWWRWHLGRAVRHI